MMLSLADVRESFNAPEDLLAQYLHLSGSVGEKRFGTRPPHIQFSNAKTDDELIDFVRQYGPVAAHRVEIKETDGLIIQSLEAVQSIRGLRREQQIFAGLVKFLVAFRQEPPDTAAILSSLVLIMESQEQPETKIRWTNSLRATVPRRRLSDNRAFRDGLRRMPKEEEELEPKVLKLFGRIVFCELLNMYPPMLSPFVTHAVELPPHEPAGILPALYFMLRRDYLNEYGLQICAFTECRKFFAIERYGQRFCSADCSRLQRQREYWMRRGAEQRERRVAEKRKGEEAKKGKKAVKRAVTVKRVVVKLAK